MHKSTTSLIQWMDKGAYLALDKPILLKPHFPYRRWLDYQFTEERERYSLPIVKPHL